jgi:glucosamine-6-phosphate isomerase
MQIYIKKNYSDFSEAAANFTATYINENPGALLCIAAGNTPLGMLERLVALHRSKITDLCSVYYAGLDEWIGLGSDDTGSCQKVMMEAFYEPAGIPKDRFRLFDGLDSDCERQCAFMDEWIALRGGIGITILGVGMNGHVGFNEPGTPDVRGCFMATLDDVTIKAAEKYSINPGLRLSAGITIGWRTLYDARTVVLMASGFAKADIMKTALVGPVCADIPASLFQTHDNVTIFLDEGAASKLTK